MAGHRVPSLRRRWFGDSPKLLGEIGACGLFPNSLARRRWAEVATAAREAGEATGSRLRPLISIHRISLHPVSPIFSISIEMPSVVAFAAVRSAPRIVMDSLAGFGWRGTVHS